LGQIAGSVRGVKNEVRGRTQSYKKSAVNRNAAKIFRRFRRWKRIGERMRGW
jgi:hypothetical protein